jgi:hypothetical protein
MRKTKIVVIPGERSEEPGHRDGGKRFYIRELASRPAEKWAARAFLALTHSQVDLPARVGSDVRRARGSMAEIATLARLVGHLNFPELDPLLDELMACVRFVVDEGLASSTAGAQGTRPIHDAGDDNDDVEEVATRWLLRQEVVDLHIGFFLAGMVLNLIALGSTMTDISTTSSSPSTRTSRRR